MSNPVKATADKLITQNGTTTTKEIKDQLRKDLPFGYWTQTNISNAMDALAKQGWYNYTDNGTFRSYTTTSAKVQKQHPLTAVLNAVFGTQQPVASAPAKKAAPAKKTTVAATTTAGKSTISRTKALDMMKNNKGRFFTVTFIKKDGTSRTMNGQYATDQANSTLGYVQVKESGKLKKGENAIRNVNLQTLQTLKIAGIVYTVK